MTKAKQPKKNGASKMYLIDIILNLHDKSKWIITYLVQKSITRFLNWLIIIPIYIILNSSEHKLITLYISNLSKSISDLCIYTYCFESDKQFKFFSDNQTYIGTFWSEVELFTPCIETRLHIILYLQCTTQKSTLSDNLPPKLFNFLYYIVSLNKGSVIDGFQVSGT